jgi:high-affinity Fe2+/Pb2+ permease
MFGFKRNKEAERFYLLPGQGGQAWRRKQKFILKWAIVVGLLVAAVLGALLYFLNKPKR